MKEKKSKKHMIRAKNVIIIISVLLLLFIGVFYVYTLDYYRADTVSKSLLSNENVSILSNGKYIVFYPDQPVDKKTGFIFYPGGKVEYTAYSQLLMDLSKQGITCILVKMPFNLAVFDINAADKVFGSFPDLKYWFLGGHSLGGAMASSYVEKSNEKLDGLVLLGAYPLNDTGLPTITIYGSEDYGLDMEKLNLAYDQVRIEGGNHSYFGNYGNQKGDGVATITREEEQRQAIEAIVSFMIDQYK